MPHKTDVIEAAHVLRNLYKGQDASISVSCDGSVNGMIWHSQIFPGLYVSTGLKRNLDDLLEYATKHVDSAPRKMTAADIGLSEPQAAE